MNKTKNTKVNLENAKTLIPYRDLKLESGRAGYDISYSNLDRSQNNSFVSESILNSDRSI